MENTPLSLVSMHEPIDGVTPCVTVAKISCLFIFSINPTDYSSVTKFYIPKIRIEGHYRMQGRILVLPLVGSGKCWFEPCESNRKEKPRAPALQLI